MTSSIIKLCICKLQTISLNRPINRWDSKLIGAKMAESPHILHAVDSKSRPCTRPVSSHYPDYPYIYIMLCQETRNTELYPQAMEAVNIQSLRQFHHPPLLGKYKKPETHLSHSTYSTDRPCETSQL